MLNQHRLIYLYPVANDKEGQTPHYNYNYPLKKYYSPFIDESSSTINEIHMAATNFERYYQP